MHFVAKATPINDIDGKSHKTTVKQQKLFNQSYKVKITLLQLFMASGVYTHRVKVNSSLTSIDVLPSKNQVLCEYCTLVSKLKLLIFSVKT